MKQSKFWFWVKLLASPVALIALGVLLFLNPDSASAFLAAALVWCLVLVGAGLAIAAVAIRQGTAAKVLGAAVCLFLGIWLLRNPLLLAAGLGRLVGILLLIRGIQDLLSSRFTQGRLLSLITAVVGLILLLLPMTTSRLVFSLCGLVVLGLGIVMLLERLRLRRLLDEGDDPDIIDAL